MTGSDLDAVDRETYAKMPCSRCGFVGALEIFWRLEARPLGTWSLAGAQPKTAAVSWPHMRCSADRGGCGAECRGKQSGPRAQP